MTTWWSGNDFGLIWHNGIALLPGDIGSQAAAEIWSQQPQDVSEFLDRVVSVTDTTLRTMPEWVVAIRDESGWVVAARGGSFVMTVDGHDSTGAGYSTWLERRVTSLQYVGRTKPAAGCHGLPIIAGVVQCGALNPGELAARQGEISQNLSIPIGVATMQSVSLSHSELPVDFGSTDTPSQDEVSLALVHPIPVQQDPIPAQPFAPEISSTDPTCGIAKTQLIELCAVQPPLAQPAMLAAAGESVAQTVMHDVQDSVSRLSPISTVESAEITSVSSAADPWWPRSISSDISHETLIQFDDGDGIEPLEDKAFDSAVPPHCRSEPEPSTTAKKQAFDHEQDWTRFEADHLDGHAHQNEGFFSGDHDGQTVMDWELGPGLPVEADSDPTLLLGLQCPAGHANPPHRVECRVCGTHLDGFPERIQVNSVGSVQLSTGESFDIRSGLIFGRDPKTIGDDQLIAIDAAHISSNHVKLRVEGWSVLAIDLRSRNGTFLRRQGEPVVRLPDQPVLLVAGDELDLGQGVVLTMKDIP